MWSGFLYKIDKDGIYWVLMKNGQLNGDAQEGFKMIYIPEDEQEVGLSEAENQTRLENKLLWHNLWHYNDAVNDKNERKYFVDVKATTPKVEERPDWVALEDASNITPG